MYHEWMKHDFWHEYTNIKIFNRNLQKRNQKIKKKKKLTGIHLSGHDDRIKEGVAQPGSLGSEIKFHGNYIFGVVHDFEAQHNHIPSLRRVDISNIDD